MFGQPTACAQAWRRAPGSVGWHPAGRRLRPPFFLLAALLLLLPSCPAGQDEPSADELYACINDGHEPRPTVFKDFVTEAPARLHLRKAWWSSHPRTVELTVVTALTPSRLEQLGAQCLSWKGPLSAAMYSAVINNASAGLSDENEKFLQETEVQLDALAARMEKAGACQLDLLMVYEVVADDLMRELLPINTIRNYALLQARTQLIAMIDVDLLVSRQLHEWLSVPEQYQSMKTNCGRKMVYVLPAFETKPHVNMTAGWEIAHNAIQVEKDELNEMMNAKLLMQFAIMIFKKGHSATNYSRWLKSKGEYEIKYSRSYEPWFIIDRSLNPFYDERFRGYGWNKVTQVDNVFYQNFRFLAHGSGFIVHRQHSRSLADKLYQSQKKQKPQDNLHTLTHKFRSRVLREIDKGYYRPLVDAGVLACTKSLSWWRDINVTPFVTAPQNEAKELAAKDAAAAADTAAPARGASPSSHSGSRGAMFRR